jgi:type VI secretion system protein
MLVRNAPRGLALLLLALAGCGVAKSLPTSVLGQLGVVAEPGANNDAATALDVVFVYDPQAGPVLPPTGAEWFARKAAYLQKLGPAIDVVSQELAPATTVRDVALPPRYRRAVAVYAYANYLAPAGQPRLSLGAYPRAVIRLAPDHVVASKGNGA